MPHCTASFKGLYLRLGNIGHGGTLETNFITLLTAHCDVLGSTLGGGNSIPFFTAHFDVRGTAVGEGALPFGPIAPFLWHLPYLVIPLLTAHCNELGSALGGGNSIPFFIAHFDVLGTALGGGALLLDQLHLSCGTCHHPGVQFVVVVETLSFSWAQVVLPPPWEFEREQVVVPSFTLHFVCSAWHLVSLLLWLTESQQACAFSSVLYTVEGQCIEADQGGMSVSHG